MNLINSIFVLACVLLTSMPVFSQSSLNGDTKNDILIDEKKPAAYLEFVKLGQCIKDYSNFNFGNLCTSKSRETYTFEAFWLRFVNNTRWTIGLTVDKGATEANSVPVLLKSTAAVNEKGETTYVGAMVANDGAEMDVVYKAESETGCDFSEETPKGEICKRRETTVPKIPLPTLSSDVFVSPGQSIIFPINREHIKKYINLYVLYNFEWEYSGKYFSHTPQFYLQHRVYFGWFELEKGIKQEEEKKQKKNTF